MYYYLIQSLILHGNLQYFKRNLDHILAEHMKLLNVTVRTKFKMIQVMNILHKSFTQLTL